MGGRDRSDRESLAVVLKSPSGLSLGSIPLCRPACSFSQGRGRKLGGQRAPASCIDFGHLGVCACAWRVARAQCVFELVTNRTRAAWYWMGNPAKQNSAQKAPSWYDPPP